MAHSVANFRLYCRSLSSEMQTSNKSGTDTAVWTLATLSMTEAERWRQGWRGNSITTWLLPQAASMTKMP